MENAVDLHALEAALHQFGEFLPVFALAPAHERREQVEPRALRQRHDAVDHLRDGLALDRQPGRGRIGDADSRPQEAHIVVDLGDGAHRRARVLRGGLLLDRDGRRQSVDLVDVRLLHHFEELARIGRERFDIAALALGIDRVEGERRFSRAGQAGEHHQPIARNLDVDVLQIVLARAADRDHAAVGTSRRVAQLIHAVHANQRRQDRLRGRRRRRARKIMRKDGHCHRAMIHAALRWAAPTLIRHCRA